MQRLYINDGYSLQVSFVIVCLFFNGGYGGLFQKDICLHKTPLHIQRDDGSTPLFNFGLVLNFDRGVL